MTGNCVCMYLHARVCIYISCMRVSCMAVGNIDGMYTRAPFSQLRRCLEAGQALDFRAVQSQDTKTLACFPAQLLYIQLHECLNLI